MEKTALERKLEKSAAAKKITAILLCLFACAVSAFAADSIAELDEAGNRLVEFLQASWLKALCIAALIVESIIFLKSGEQRGEVFRKLSPVIVAEIVIFAAPDIVAFFWND